MSVTVTVTDIDIDTVTATATASAQFACWMHVRVWSTVASVLATALDSLLRQQQVRGRVLALHSLFAP